MLREYTNHLQTLLHKSYEFQPMEKRPTVSVEVGRKFYKIVFNYEYQRSVHSFVEKETLDVYKAASWNAPAKGVRYNLVRDMDQLKVVADSHGGYLYKR